MIDNAKRNEMRALCIASNTGWPHDHKAFEIAARNALPALLDDLDAKDAEIEQLKSEIVTVQAERDEAVTSLASGVNPCEYCKYAVDGDAMLCEECENYEECGEGDAPLCKDRPYESCDACFHGGRYECQEEDNFKWRGLAKGEATDA